jgi:glycosyltransferase involved in cell wall biosynthesis
MTKPTLILLCDNYPLSSGEFFIDDEMKVIHSHFEKIFVLIKDQEKQQLNRFIPDNLEIITYNSTISVKHKIKAIPQIFPTYFISELFRAVFKFKIKPTPLLFKVMFMDIVRSNITINEIKKLQKTKDLSIENTIYYSYWHDYKAFALSRLSKRNKTIKTFARAHRWDIYFEANNFPYLPFKYFIIKNLSKTVSISADGIKYFENLLKKDIKNKIVISKLGKINSRKLQLEKKSTPVLICSCSNLIPVKRVTLIIDLLAELEIDNLKWIHFGDGSLREEIEIYANEKLKHINFELRGVVPNNEILDFYSQNYVDLFINLSESEGIPVSIMEALSAGIPVLATDVGGTSEIVNDNFGFLINQDVNINSIATLVRNYIEKPHQDIVIYRKKSFEFWQNNYNAFNNYDSFIKLLID